MIKKKTNVLIFLTDQQRYDTVAAGGYPHMITPNLDRLAQEGVMYENAYSSNPVCMPARHDLITGFPATVHGYYSNRKAQRIKDYSIPTIARIFSDQDYRTVAIGKMHFSPPREHHGFDYMFSMEELPDIRQSDDYLMYLEKNEMEEIQNPHGVRPHIYHIPQISCQDEAHHGTSWVAETAINWIKENKENPFFMICGFIQPHPPWSIPAECKNWYEGIELPEPIPVSRLPYEEETRGEWFGDKDSSKQKKKIRQAYYTAITMIDKYIGKVVEYLREIEKLDDTLIIFTSDHGEMLQDKGYYSKELPYDSSARIPFIIRYPDKFPKGTIRTEFVDLLDILPTCLDVCGIKYPDKERTLYGESLVQGKARSYQFSSTGNLPERWVMCRNKKYKYVYYYLGGYEELYDMEKDEVENLILNGVADYLKPIYQELKEQTLEYEKKWGIADSVVNGKFRVFPMRYVHPQLRGKFHFWANKQTQEFYEDREKCVERLNYEMEYALSDYQFSGVQLSEVFKDQEWEEQLSEQIKNYGKGKGNLNFLCHHKI